MQTGEQKILYFQYVLHKLYEVLNFSNSSNDLSVLKSLKLLFFITAAKSSNQDNESVVDTVFNNFSALPYGHVETDVYEQIKKLGGNLEYFSIDSSKVVFKGNNDFQIKINQLNQSYIAKIDESILYLQKNHPSLFSSQAFDLVELSHKWYSWQKNYKEAISKGFKSQKIPKEDIKSESKIFTL